MDTVEAYGNDLEVIEVYSESDYVGDDSPGVQCCGCDDFCPCQSTCAIV